MCEFCTPPGAWPWAAGPEARKTPDNPCGMSGWIRGPPAPSSRGLRPPHPLQRSDPVVLFFCCWVGPKLGIKVGPTGVDIPNEPT